MKRSTPDEAVQTPPVVAADSTKQENSAMPEQNKWQQNFVRNLENVRGHWLRHFEHAMTDCAQPAFDDVSSFVSKHGFRASVPMKQGDRRSFKYELAENAYVLVWFRHEGIDDLLMTSEYFVPGKNPGNYEMRMNCADVTRDWCRLQFEEALDSFLGAFNTPGAVEKTAAPEMELLAV